jgi:hypothetical protein
MKSTEDILRSLETRAYRNPARRAWIYTNCCLEDGPRCRLTAVYHPNLGYDFLHHGEWISNAEVLTLVEDLR